MARLRVIQAGVGGHGRGWLDLLRTRDDVELVAVVDPNAAARDAATAHVEVPGYPDLRAALAVSPADLVVSVTPPAVHAEHAEVALRAGCHLLVEKPLADTLANARRMRQVAATHRRTIAVAQQRRFDPFARALRDAVAAKQVGPIAHGHVDFRMASAFPGTFRETMRHVLLVDMAIHHVDALRHVLQADVARVWATDFNPPAATGVFASGAAVRMVMTLVDGRVISYAGDWSARGQSTGWDGHWHLQGERGDVTLDARRDGRDERPQRFRRAGDVDAAR